MLLWRNICKGKLWFFWNFLLKYRKIFRNITLRDGPPIIYGKNPTDLPNYELGKYESGPNTIVGCYSGPNGGLTTVKRTEKHLSVPDDDIDFIDNPEEEELGKLLCYYYLFIT